jgi:diguanylate cyclase (GGDEF)-like protein
MVFKKNYDWLTGGEGLSEINRVFNVSCLVGLMFGVLSGIESIFASLSPIVIANNFFYSLVLAIAFYFSRFKKRFSISRFLSIFTLIFIYTPLIWIYNGGLRSGVPFFILLFVSFITVSTVGKKESWKIKIITGSVILVFCAVVVGLILLDFAHPEIIYQYPNQSIQITDILISLVFALLGNFVIIRAFINLYYKQLEKVEDYSDRLEDMVIRDSMTHLFNHVFVITRLSEEVNRMARKSSSLSILMIDIDHFKKINDSYGHVFGDDVIKQISHTLQSNCRSIDIVARYGGEEFLIILPDTSLQIANMVGNRLLGLIRSKQFDNQLTVTVSAGIAQYEPGDTPSSMIEKADANLYQAKHAGRDQLKS